jgi:hypothetical protein
MMFSICVILILIILIYLIIVMMKDIDNQRIIILKLSEVVLHHQLFLEEIIKQNIKGEKK